MAVATVVVLLVAAACSTPPAPRQADRDARSATASSDFSVPAPTGRVAVEVGDIGREVVIDGRIAPRDATAIESTVNGSVASLDVRQGDTVAAGDPIATIDLGPDASRAIIAHELALARRDLAVLRGEPTASLDEALAAATDRLIELDLDPTRFDELGIDPSAGAVTVVADRSGLVVSTNTRFGATIDAGDTVVVVGDPDDLVARGTAAVSQLDVIQAGDDVDVVPRDDSLAPTFGVVLGDEVGAAGEPMASPRAVAVELDDPRALDLGTRVSIVVRLETVTDVLWVPPSALRGTGDERFVLVDRNGDQERVEVVTGLQTDDRAEIVSVNGLAELDAAVLAVGDLVVLP